jgi:hypothetical protein
VFSILVGVVWQYMVFSVYIPVVAVESIISVSKNMVPVAGLNEYAEDKLAAAAGYV